MRILLAASLLAGLAVSLQASNHREAPITAMGKDAGAADLYALIRYSGARATLVICTDPLLGAGKAAAFDPALTYEAKVDNNGDSREDLAFRVRFLPGPGQHYRVEMIRGGAVLELGSTDGRTLEAGRGQSLTQGVKVFAGMVADPAAVTVDRARTASGGTGTIALEVPVEMISRGARTPAALEASVSVWAVAIRGKAAMPAAAALRK